MNEVRDGFKDSIEVLANWEGRVRPDDAEHFGYRDGIAQPALMSVVSRQ
jgi:deferrochelatase/peroxidase EfeB